MAATERRSGLVSAIALNGNKTTREVLSELVRFIQSSGLVAGDQLPPIRRLAAEFQTSASVVRDALVQAQTMGLVKILPRSGAFVRAVDYAPLVDVLEQTMEGAFRQPDHNLFHLLECRELVEIQCAARAASRRRLEDLLPVREALQQMDEALLLIDSPRSAEGRVQYAESDIRFHLAIAQIAGNPVCSTILRALLGLIRPHLLQIPWTAEVKQATHRAHLRLYEALLAGDADGAAACMQEHVKLSYTGLLQKIMSTPGGALPGSSAGEGHASDPQA